MTKEELEKEAIAKYKTGSYPQLHPDIHTFIHGYLAGSEPREKRIAKLENHNEELIDLVNAERGRQEKCNDIHLQTITKLDKENANLKALRKYELNLAKLEIEKLEKENKQLNKAKELLREIIDTPVFNQMGCDLYENEGYTELVEEAEQFLKQE